MSGALHPSPFLPLPSFPIPFSRFFPVLHTQPGLSLVDILRFRSGPLSDFFPPPSFSPPGSLYFCSFLDQRERTGWLFLFVFFVLCFFALCILTSLTSRLIHFKPPNSTPFPYPKEAPSPTSKHKREVHLRFPSIPLHPTNTFPFPSFSVNLLSKLNERSVNTGFTPPHPSPPLSTRPPGPNCGMFPLFFWRFFDWSPFPTFNVSCVVGQVFFAAVIILLFPL